MRVKQISIFVENKPGKLLEILEALEKAQINIRALSISESGEFGIVRMIPLHAEQSQESLRKAGFISRPLTKAGINLKYFYAYTDPSTNQAMVVLKPDDLDKAEKILASL
jgi:hypothetical protein